MKSATLAVALLALAAAPAAAQDSPSRGADASNPTLQVIRTSDAELDCSQISDEAAQLSEQLGGEPEGGLFGRLGGVAKAGAAMVIPGAGLVTAAADALTQPRRDRREAAEATVQHRWYYLNGLYAGRRCQAQAEAAVNPAPPPAIAPAPTAAPAPIPAPASTPSAASAPAPAITPAALTPAAPR